MYRWRSAWTEVGLSDESLRTCTPSKDNALHYSPNLGNFAMFEHLSTEIEESGTIFVVNLREVLNNLLQSLESEIRRYLLEFSEQRPALARNPFYVSLDIKKNRSLSTPIPKTYDLGNVLYTQPNSLHIFFICMVSTVVLMSFIKVHHIMVTL